MTKFLVVMVLWSGLYSSEDAALIEGFHNMSECQKMRTTFEKSFDPSETWKTKCIRLARN